MKNIKVYEEYNTLSEGQTFNDVDISRYEKLWNTLHVKYTNNPFFLSLYKQMKSKRSLSDKQWQEFEYLLKNGRTRYEAGILPHKN